MPRVRLFELEDFPWFPDAIRRGMTDYFRFVAEATRMYAAAAPLLATLLRRTGARRLVDLCAGGGGVAHLQQEIARISGEHVQLTLTDKYPNLDAFERLRRVSNGAIDYVADPVDALHLPDEPRGALLMLSAFHHFAPPEARSILCAAAERREPIAIIEVKAAGVPGLISLVVGLPPLAALSALLSRPFHVTSAIFTFLVPLIPACLLWDGLVSSYRIYSVEELEELTASVRASGYRWEVGERRNLPGSKLIYLLGWPELAGGPAPGAAG
jgi:hypothetical protein